MLPTHGRYDYSWPGGRRLAVYLALNIEAFGFGVGKGAAIAPPDQAQSHSVYSWRDYGNRVGIWRLFELLDEQGHLAEDRERALIAEATAAIERHEGAPPVFWMSPWLSNSAALIALMHE